MAALASTDLKEELVDLNETRKAVENAENRARLEQRRSDAKIGRRNNREYAQALHCEADQLYRNGDYETALVLYHRAANLFPRDSSHGVAARRTAATISSCNNPSKALRKALPSARNGERLTMSLCPETAAMLANDRLKKSPDPSSVVEVLSYFDTHKSLWKTLPSPRPSNTQLARAKTTPSNHQLANLSLTNLRISFNSGKMTTALKIAQDLLILSAGFQDPSRYQIAAYRYLSLIHVALGRHDRAVCSVSRLVRLSKSTEDVVQIYRSLVTLGKVHLSFGHLNAAAKAWEHLSKDLKEPIPVAWIRHEIGRCHLETGKYKQAMDMAVKCVNAAVKGNSKKWLLYGKLLLGLSLAKLGRFVEALEELQVAAKITEEEGDTPMLSYIRDLVDQVADALRRIPFKNERLRMEQSKISSSCNQRNEDTSGQSTVFVSQEETVITTMFSQRIITEYHDDASSSEDASIDEGITTHSDKTRELMQSDRESTVRSDLQERTELPLRGDSTFRVESPRKQDASLLSSSSTSSSTSSSSSSSSSSSASSSSLASFNEEEKDEDAEETAEALDPDKAENNVQKEDLQAVSSNASLKSANTTATYVIEGGDASGETKLDNERQKRFSRLIDKVTEEEASKILAAIDNTSRREGNILNDGYVLQVIEQLDKMGELELLMLLREKLLEEDWGQSLGQSGDTNRESFRTSRSRDDGANGDLANH